MGKNKHQNQKAIVSGIKSYYETFVDDSREIIFLYLSCMRKQALGFQGEFLWCKKQLLRSENAHFNYFVYIVNWYSHTVLGLIWN